MTEILTDLSESALRAAIQDSAYAYFVRRERILGKTVAEEDGLAWLLAANATPVAWLREGVEEGRAPGQVQSALGRMQARGYPEVYVVALETGETGAVWQRCGASLIETEHAMAMPLIAVGESMPNIEGLIVERITGEAGLQDCAAVIAAGRDQWTGGFFQLTNSSLAASQDYLRYYLARLDGRPAATAVLFFAAGLATIWWVTTVPEFRGRGIGSAILRSVLLDAFHLGYRAVMLEAPPDDVPHYRRMGFREYCRINVYRWKPGTTQA
jgi:ribosomal protein S18 acetylase RimI-like enzyme